MNRDQQIERAWQLMLGAQRDLAHAEDVAAQKRDMFNKANAALRALLTPDTTITDEHIVARILEVV